MKGLLQGAVGTLAFMAMLTVVTPEAEAISFGFTKITNNNVEDISSQLSFEAVDIGGNQVRFDFKNNVGIASSVSEVYFDDNGGVLDPPVAQVINFGTNFSDNGMASPGDLPSGINAIPSFVADSFLSADTNPGPPSNGIDTNVDVLGVVFNITGGKNFNDVIAALNAETLRSGLHVRSIGAAGGSDSFVSGGLNAVNPVPEPSTMMLLGSGLVGLIGYRMRKAQA